MQMRTITITEDELSELERGGDLGHTVETDGALIRYVRSPLVLMLGMVEGPPYTEEENDNHACPLITDSAAERLRAGESIDYERQDVSIVLEE